MSQNNSNNHQLPCSDGYAPPACFYYYYNPPRLYQPSTIFEQPLALSDDPIQSKTTTNRFRKNRHQRKNSNVTNKSVQTVPMSSDDHKITNIEQLDLHTSKQHYSLDKKQSTQTSSLTFQHSETVHQTQQLQIFSPIDTYCRILKNQSTTIINEELTEILDKVTLSVKNSASNNQQQQQQQQLPILINILDALLAVPSTVLIPVSQNELFPILQISLINALRRWREFTLPSDNESAFFRSMAKLFNILTDDTSLIPSWLSDSTLLETTANCLTDIASSAKFLDYHNRHNFKHFTHLLDAYILYQQHFKHHTHHNKDTFIHLLDPILHCLTSNHFISTFTHLHPDATSMTTIQKFFLLKCPAFLISYNGSRLEQTMDSLLSVMLPQYVKILDKFVPAAHNWNRPMMKAVQHLLDTISHGADQFSTNAKVIRDHLPLVDHVLSLVNEPVFYNNLDETLSSPETTLMNSAITFLVNMINEPTILAHIKQCRAASAFLRVTSCRYEPLVLNVYTLLAYTTHEDDIKTMPNSDQLLTTVIQSIKATMKHKSERGTQMEQLLETLKGLIQHDQLKDEIIKQNALPFLLELTNELTGKALLLLFEILWSLSFSEEIARSLCSNADFLEKIQTISNDNNNEALKKAADGLVWKLIREPAFLKKVTKHENEQKGEADGVSVTKEVVIGADGKEQVIETIRDGSTSPSDGSYQYDIMISYCHADKELTYKIHKFLTDKGFKIWIDLENMYGPAMSAMADAVENSEFVIMCMSDSYKQSTYCQAEAEYAFKCKRRLIPLIVRAGYKPDGWLGFMIGSRIYVDFGRFDFDTACDKLMTEINLQRKKSRATASVQGSDYKNPVKTTPIASRPGQRNRKSSSKHIHDEVPVKKNILSSLIKVAQTKLDFARKSIDQWSTVDVATFLLTQHLNQMIPLCEEMNGRSLIQLYKICVTHRLRAYTVLKDELKSVHKTDISINTYSRFLTVIEDAMKSLQTPPQSVISAPPPPPPLPLPPAPSLSAPVNLPMGLPPMPFIPAPYLDSTYDFLITSDASPFETLKMVEQYSTQLQILDYLRHRIISVV